MYIFFFIIFFTTLYMYDVLLHATFSALKSLIIVKGPPELCNGAVVHRLEQTVGRCASLVSPIPYKKHLPFKLDQICIAVVEIRGVACPTLLVFWKLRVVYLPVKCVRNHHWIKRRVLPAAGCKSP